MADPAEDPVAAMMSADLASETLGIELVAWGHGWAVTTMTVGPTMVNGFGIAHGGLVFALADTAFACACNGAGGVTVASGAEITFVRPARTGDVLEARAEVRSLSGRKGVYDVTVRRGDEVVAEFRGHSHQLAGRP